MPNESKYFIMTQPLGKVEHLTEAGSPDQSQTCDSTQHIGMTCWDPEVEVRHSNADDMPYHLDYFLCKPLKFVYIQIKL
jgi:hypothetical protein